MKESNDILDNIERYTKGKMSVDEKVAFEKELAIDESLREQLQFSQIVDQMIIGNETLKLKEQMQKDLYSTKPKLGKYLAISLLVLVASAGLFVVLNKKEDKTHVSIPTSDVPKIIQQAQIQEADAPIVTKATVTKEVNRNTSVSSASSEIQVASVQPSESPNASVSSSVQTVRPVKAVEELSQTVVAKVDPCAGLVGDVEFYTIASCKGQETGEVHLKTETVKGGLAPFTFKLGERSAKNYFDRLASGQYSLFIKDANDCSVENIKKVMVAEKKCVERKEYVFNPEYDSSWPIPYDNEKAASNFKILEKSEKVFYQTSLSASHLTEWKGESNTGLVLGMGIYFFTIEYADGSIDEGSIVVTR